MSTDHGGCRQLLIDKMAAAGCEIVASSEPPLVDNIWTQAYTCPHGTTYYIEPTSEQRMAWARDGVR